MLGLRGGIFSRGRLFGTRVTQPMGLVDDHRRGRFEITLGQPIVALDLQRGLPVGEAVVLRLELRSDGRGGDCQHRIASVLTGCQGSQRLPAAQSMVDEHPAFRIVACVRNPLLLGLELCPAQQFRKLDDG